MGEGSRRGVGVESLVFRARSLPRLVGGGRRGPRYGDRQARSFPAEPLATASVSRAAESRRSPSHVGQ